MCSIHPTDLKQQVYFKAMYKSLSFLTPFLKKMTYPKHTTIFFVESFHPKSTKSRFNSGLLTAAEPVLRRLDVPRAAAGAEQGVEGHNGGITHLLAPERVGFRTKLS